MLQINSDLSIYVTRGDAIVLTVGRDLDFDGYEFKAGDSVGFKVFGKKKTPDVYINKLIRVREDTNVVEIPLSEAEMKIGAPINKPTDYWYEITLNPDTEPKTIIGYDESGAKVLKLFPEGGDTLEDEEGKPLKPILPIDEELDEYSKNAIQNKAVYIEVQKLHQHIEDSVAKAKEELTDSVTDIVLGIVADTTVKDGSVTTEKIADEAVTNEKLADGAVDNSKIAIGTIEASRLSANSVTESKINDGAVSTNKIADSAVNTGKINDSAVTESKLADGSVTTKKIKDGNVTTAKVADGAITTEKIADLSVARDKIADKAITRHKLADESVYEEKIADGTISTPKLMKDVVTTSKLHNDAVTTDKIADKNITRAKLADDALYSPVVRITANRNFALTDLGKTIQVDNSSVAFNMQITADLHSSFPVGGEIAVIWWNATSIKVGTASGVYLNHVDGGSSNGAQFNLTAKNAMIALKKVTSASWIITGNCEHA